MCIRDRSLPLVVLLAFIWACNAFAFDVGSLAESGLGGVSAGFAEGWQPVALAGRFGFVPQGCMFALFYAVRILLILWASFAVSFTTSVEEMCIRDSLVGVDLPRDKRIEVGLTYIYGIGLTTSKKILAETGVNPDTRVNDLTEDELSKLRDYIQANLCLLYTSNSYVRLL